MSFSAAQKTLVNEILGIFEGGSFEWLTYNDTVTGEITSTPFGNTISFTQAQASLATIFTAIEAAGDNREVRIGEILTEYDDIDFETATFAMGGASGAPGLRFDPRTKRAHLKDLLERNLGLQVRIAGSTGGSGRAIHLVR